MNPKSIGAYWPLISLVLIAALAAAALMHGEQKTVSESMHYFMGFFFCQFAMLKIFHVPGFVEGFEKYDLIAMRFRPYAFIYPFIELGLGLAYLASFYPVFVNLLTILVAAVGATGVIQALRKGLDLRCACMGTILDVPLTTVTLTEDIAMGCMAILMLIF